MERMNNLSSLSKLAQRIRSNCLIATTRAGSGHPTSSLSAVELMTALFFGGFFHFDFKRPHFENNDRLIFSKGHASPLLYALYAAAGGISEKELWQLRRFDSPLEGHPVPRFPFAEAATGSLGQGLSIGVGMALNAKYLDRLSYRTFVLLGDSEMSEGSVWEAVQIAAHYRLDNLIGIIDVNRLGQRGETMYGHEVREYQKRLWSFGWKTLLVDGHHLGRICQAYRKALAYRGSPVMIIAKTVKGKGVRFLEGKEGWHGKPLNEQQLKRALKEVGYMGDEVVRGSLMRPRMVYSRKSASRASVKKIPAPAYRLGEAVPTRKAYGEALVQIFPRYHKTMVVLDAEVSNSTFSKIFQEAYPKRFFEMFIAEQNMVGTALGLARRGKLPFVSTFAAFLTRAFDQIRMSRYSEANIKFCGSHAGVSIGEDGPSQMGLEDIAMFRTILDSVVFYPADAVATLKLVEQAAKYRGIVYIRTTRSATPVIYRKSESFPIGGSKTLTFSAKDDVTLIGAGITLFEALKAAEELKKHRINARVIDLYCVKPVDTETLMKAARETKAIITIEDHFAEGGIGEAVRSVVPGAQIFSLAVRKMPRSGMPSELLDYEDISARSVVKKVFEILS